MFKAQDNHKDSTLDDRQDPSFDEPTIEGMQAEVVHLQHPSIASLAHLESSIFRP